MAGLKAPKKPRTVDFKECSKCFVTKGWEEFYRSSLQEDGLTRRCIQCTAVANDEQRVRTRIRDSLRFLMDAGYEITYDGQDVAYPEGRIPRKRGTPRSVPRPE